MINNLRLPPFGKILAAYQESKINLKTYIRIFVGQDGKRFAYDDIQYIGGLCTYLPYGDDYMQYNWPISGQNVVIEDTSLTSVMLLRKMSIHLLNIYSPHWIVLSSKSLDEPELFTHQKNGEKNEN